MIKIFLKMFICIILIVQMYSCNDKILDYEQEKTKINTPDSLTIISSSEKSLTLKWNDNNSDEVGYLIERGNGKNPTSFTELASVKANVTEYTDSDLLKTNIYSYRLRALGQKIKSDFTEIISVEIGNGILLKSFNGHSKKIKAMAISPDGNMLATAGDDKTIILWNINTGNQIRQLSGHNIGITLLEFSADGNRLVSVDSLSLIVWNPQTGNTVLTNPIALPATPQCLDISPDNKQIAVGFKYLHIYDLSTGTFIKKLTLGNNSSKGISSIAYSNDSKYIIGYYVEDGIRKWDVENSKVKWFIEQYIHFGYVAFSSDDQFFAVAYEYLNPIELRRTVSGNIAKEFGNGFDYYIGSLDYSTNGNMIAISSISTFADGYHSIIYDINSKEISATIIENSPIRKIIITPNNNVITATNSKDEYIANLWNLGSKWTVIK